MTHHPMARKHSTVLTPEQVAEIRKAYADKLFTQAQLAQLYNVHQTTISELVRGLSWKNV